MAFALWTFKDTIEANTHRFIGWVRTMDHITIAMAVLLVLFPPYTACVACHHATGITGTEWFKFRIITMDWKMINLVHNIVHVSQIDQHVP